MGDIVVSEVVRTKNPEGVVNLQALTEAKSEQARAEQIQRRILVAQLTAQTVANTEGGPSGHYVTEILEAYDTFLTVE